MPAFAIFLENLLESGKIEAYRKLVVATLAPFEGTFLVRGGKSTVIEGSWPFERTVILRFPTRAQAEAWYASPAYREILPLRLASMRTSAIIIDGVD